MNTNPRLTVIAAVAVILASISIYPLIYGVTWFWAGVGAVVVVAFAGTLTRLPPPQAGLAAAALALLASCPLLFGAPWPAKAGGLVLVAAAAASATRSRALRGLGGLITYVSALLLYLNLAFAAAESTAGIVPTMNSLRYLSSLAGQGLAERTSAPPVAPIAGVILLAAGGIGLMAMATDLLAVRLRSPALAGLPLLVLYSVPITTNAAQSGIAAAIVFCVAVTGYLAMLATDGRERLRRWGRLVHVWQGTDNDPAPGPDTRQLAASGRRIGLAAVCLAIIVPALVPGVGLHPLFAGYHNGSGPGGPGVPLPSPLVKMSDQLRRASPETVLTYRTTYKNPPDQYLQVFVLNYDAGSEKFTLITPQAGTAVSSGALAAAPGLAANTATINARTEIKISAGVAGYGSQLSFLPVPYAPETVNVPGSWQEAKNTLMIYSQHPLSGLAYTVTSKEAEPTNKPAARLPKYIERNYLTFPAGPGNSNELLKLANQITKGASTPRQKALELQNWFWSGRFHYSLSVNLPDDTAGLVKFLFRTRSGFCQQFAFAMAGLARLVGIPSRIAVGYTAGTPEGNGTWKVTTADAHAWPELYIPGSGWVRFEPTPGGADGQGTAVRPQYPGATTSGGSSGGSTTPTTKGTGSPKTGGATSPNRARLRVPGGSTGKAPAAAGANGSGSSLWLIPVAVLALLLVAPRLARTVARRRRWHGASDAARQAHAAWREFRDDLTDYGIGWRPSESPRAAGRRVSKTLQLDPPAQQALGRITAAEERARYAVVPLSSPALRADVTTLRRALSRHVSRPARWRARLLPPSAIAPVRGAWQYVLDVFGWLDTIVPRLRSSRAEPEQLIGGQAN
jgi:transglutaminase-like putative cysteine protease